MGEHPVFGDLQQAASGLAESVAGHPSTEFLSSQARWDPFAFVDFCEACTAGQATAEDLCQRIQFAEWRQLFDYCFRSAVGEKRAETGGE